MSSADPRNTAELQKLAHTLDVDVAAVALLADVPAADLRVLRGQIADALFRAGKPAFARVAALSKAVPTAVSAKLSQAVLPPLLAARTAELLEPAKAADLVGRLSDSYLADVSAYMDAARAPEVIAAIPTATVAKIGTELARRREWVVIAGFVGEVGEPALRASVSGFDGEQLLRVGFVLDDLARLDDISGLLTDDQVDDVLVAAAGHRLWQEFSTLLGNLAPPRLERLAVHYAKAPAAVTSAFERAVVDGALDAADLERLQAS